VKRFSFVILIILLLSVSGIYSFAQDEANVPVIVQASWLLNGEFSFVCSAIVEGYYDDEGLDVTLRAGGPVVSSLRSSTILAQDEEVLVSIEGVLTEYVEGRAHPERRDQLLVTAIGAFWQDNPLGFLVRNDGPSTLEELFMGRKSDGSRYIIGATPDAILIRAIADYFGVSYNELNIVTTGFDATPFLAGQVDALWGFWTTQAYEAEVAGVPYSFLTLSEIPNLTQPSMIILTREDTLRERPELLAKWMRASIRGAQFTIEHPDQATNHILDERCGGSDFDYDQELWLIQHSLPLFAYQEMPDCIGFINSENVESWSQTYLAITGNEFIPSINDLVDLSVLETILGDTVYEPCSSTSSISE